MPSDAIIDSERYEFASQLVRRLSLWSGAAGLIPLPLVDVTVSEASSSICWCALAKIYGVPFSENRGKSILASWAGSLTSIAMSGGANEGIRRSAPSCRRSSSSFASTPKRAKVSTHDCAWRSTLSMSVPLERAAPLFGDETGRAGNFDAQLSGDSKTASDRRDRSSDLGPPPPVDVYGKRNPAEFHRLAAKHTKLRDSALDRRRVWRRRTRRRFRCGGSNRP
jgi:hypothetical protein